MQNPYLQKVIPPVEITQPVLWFIFKGDEILVRNSDSKLPLLQSTEIASLNLEIAFQNYLGSYLGTHCFVAEGKEIGALPNGIRFAHIRDKYLELQNEELFLLTSRAKQILHWDKTTQFCGACGNKTSHSSKERAKICSECETLVFPQVSPVVMVRITRGSEILLARSPHFPPRVYSVLAGFIEPGENIEQTAHREVLEEVNLQIENLRYFGSQPWPFPSNLMIGFTADYAGGEIKIDEIEIEDAAWFQKDRLPPLPKKFSISRTLIDDFLNNSLPSRK